MLAAALRVEVIFVVSSLCFGLLRFLRRRLVCVDALHRLASAALEFAAKPDLTQRHHDLVTRRRQKLFNRRKWDKAAHKRSRVDGIRVVGMIVGIGDEKNSSGTVIPRVAGRRE